MVDHVPPEPITSPPFTLLHPAEQVDPSVFPVPLCPLCPLCVLCVPQSLRVLCVPSVSSVFSVPLCSPSLCVLRVPSPSVSSVFPSVFPVVCTVFNSSLPTTIKIRTERKYIVP